MASSSTHVLGISCFYHDAAAAILKDGVVIAAGQEERFSRKKHDSDFPHRAIQYVLHEAGLRPEELDAVGFYDKPLLKFERMLVHLRGHLPAVLPVLPQGDAGVAPREALGAVDHPEGAQALQGSRSSSPSTT